jgi:ribosome maturation factor RimP
MPGSSRHAPRPRQAAPGGALDADRIAEVIRPVVAAAGMDLESVRVTAAGRRRLLRVVVDSDRGVSLDDAATVSRELSAALDTVAVMGDFPYTLEVSSPGVDRPLTEPRHWQRAASRLVLLRLAGRGSHPGGVRALANGAWSDPRWTLT